MRLLQILIAAIMAARLAWVIVSLVREERGVPTSGNGPTARLPLRTRADSLPGPHRAPHDSI